MSRRAFREKINLLREQRDTEFLQVCYEFRQNATRKINSLHLTDSHVLYLAKHIPKTDARLLRDFANQSVLSTEDGYTFCCFPETCVRDDDPDGKEVLTGLWAVMTTF